MKINLILVVAFCFNIIIFPVRKKQKPLRISPKTTYTSWDEYDAGSESEQPDKSKPKDRKKPRDGKDKIGKFESTDSD